MVSPFGDFFPVKGLTAWENAGASTGSSRGQLITTGSANVKGSWVQLIASTSRKSTFMLICIDARPVTTADDILLDIGTGGAGAETVLIPNILLDLQTSAESYQIPLPAIVAAGARVAARAQGGTSTNTLDILAVLGGSPG